MTPLDPTSPLLDFILNLLAPFLMTSGISDPAIARAAALQAINACKADGQQNLVSIAQIVGFALASLDNLRVSMPADVSLSMKLKLRGNANTLNRSSQLATLARDNQPPPAEPQPAEPPPAEPEPEPAPQDVRTSIEAARTLIEQAPKPAARQPELSWASAMTDIATEHAATLSELPPAKRRTQLGRISALLETARVLGSGTVPLRSQLLSSTAFRT
jgi:hypothetical protein